MGPLPRLSFIPGNVPHIDLTVDSVGPGCPGWIVMTKNPKLCPGSNPG